MTPGLGDTQNMIEGAVLISRQVFIEMMLLIVYSCIEDSNMTSHRWGPEMTLSTWNGWLTQKYQNLNITAINGWIFFKI